MFKVSLGSITNDFFFFTCIQVVLVFSFLKCIWFGCLGIIASTKFKIEVFPLPFYFLEELAKDW